MSLDGRIDWTGGDPTIVHLDDNGKRKVQIRLDSGKRHSRHSDRLEIAVVVADVDTLIRELELARIWVKEGHR